MPYQFTCRLVFGFGLVYAAVTTLGLLTLESPDDPIGNPYFTLMELLSILISLLMAISMVGVHQYAAKEEKFYSLTALALIWLTSCITSVVHFLILTVGHTPEAHQLSNYSFFFSFKWPSVVYALDVLAWDLFFGLSMLFTSKVLKKGGLERKVKLLLLLSGTLSLVGLIGLPLQNMQIRNIGIVGYAVVGPFAFLLMGILIGRQNQIQD
ncbi:MAG: hypothetical protein IPN29_02980 [Saprospiraceae bacterium]|nr:hypothetical protein [Saprospiraceae bacterium]